MLIEMIREYSKSRYKGVLGYGMWWIFLCPTALCERCPSPRDNLLLELVCS